MPDRLFSEFVADLRVGRDTALRELTAVYWPQIEAGIVREIARQGLRCLVDCEDVLQDLVVHFLAGRAHNIYVPSTPHALVALLRIMAKHRVTDVARRLRREMNARAGALATQGSVAHLVARGDGVGHALERWDFFCSVVPLLSWDEYVLVWRRACGQDWMSIAAALGRPKEALRKQLDRARRRVRKHIHPE